PGSSPGVRSPSGSAAERAGSPSSVDRGNYVERRPREGAIAPATHCGAPRAAGALNDYPSSAPLSTQVTLLPQHRLTHLRQLEAESIHIIREVAAEFDRPVMMYSIGKDSSVMVRLAQKAFAPGPLPFPLLHVDTTWKFQAMYEFRDRFCRENGF